MTTRNKYWFLLIFISLSLSVSGQKPTGSELELQKQADKLYTSGNYKEAAPLYSQLLSLFPHDVLYNYRYGSSLVEAGKEKTPAIVYLEFATKNSLVPEDAWWYLGKAYMQKSSFSSASTAFVKFKSLASPTKAKKMEVDLLIANCSNANEVSKTRKDIAILSSREVKKAGFYTAYDYSETSGKLVPTADQFQSSLDKSKTKNPLMFISKDGQNIYYSSYGKGGSTGKDIYQIRKMVNGQWGIPENLGLTLNSVEDEEYPYLDRDGKTLYFSSRGHNSMGGYDLFKSVFNFNTGQWSVPENLGVPINTASDEFFFVPTMTGDQASYSTNFESNPEEVIFRNISLTGVNNRFAIISGTYFSLDQATRRDARITVVRSSDNAVVNSVRTDPKSGKYELVLPPGNDYTLLVEGGGYLAQAEVFSLPDLAVGGMRQEVKMNKDKEREQMTVSNFFTPITVKENEKVLAFKSTATNVSTSSISNTGEDSTQMIPVRINDQTVYIKDPKLNKSKDEALIPAKAVNVATYGYTEDSKSNDREAEVEDLAAKKGLLSIKLEEKDRYDPTLETRMDADELRQIEEEKERAQIIEEEERNPTILIDFNIDNDELAQIALDDAESLSEEAERMKERSRSIKANAILSDSLSLSLMDEAESLPKNETEKKAELKSRAAELKEESILLNRQASDLLLQASIKLDESRAARKDADAILISSGRGPSVASNAPRTSGNVKLQPKSNTVNRQEEISANNANLATGSDGFIADEANEEVDASSIVSKDAELNSKGNVSDAQVLSTQTTEESRRDPQNEAGEPVSKNSEPGLASNSIQTSTTDDLTGTTDESSSTAQKNIDDTKGPSDRDSQNTTESDLENQNVPTANSSSKHTAAKSTDVKKTTVKDSEKLSGENQTKLASIEKPFTNETEEMSKGEAETSPQSTTETVSQIDTNNNSQANSQSGDKSTSVPNALPQGQAGSEIALGTDVKSDPTNESTQSNADKTNSTASEDESDANAELNFSGTKSNKTQESIPDNNSSNTSQDFSEPATDNNLSAENATSKKKGETESFIESSTPENTEAKSSNEPLDENQVTSSDEAKSKENTSSDPVAESPKPTTLSQEQSVAAARENLIKNIEKANSGVEQKNTSSTDELAEVEQLKKSTDQVTTSTTNQSELISTDESKTEQEIVDLTPPAQQENEPVKNTEELINDSAPIIQNVKTVSSSNVKTAQTATAAVPIREKYILPETERSQIDPETKIVFESYERNLKSSEQLFVQSRVLQDRVLSMPKSPERDSLLEVSNAMSRESGSQYNIAQSQLEDAMQMDSALSDKLQYTKAPVITSDQIVAAKTQQEVNSSGGSVQTSNEPVEDLSATNIPSNDPDQPLSASNLNVSTQVNNSRPDEKVLSSKIAPSQQSTGGIPAKSTVADPNEPLRKVDNGALSQYGTEDESKDFSEQNSAVESTVESEISTNGTESPSSDIDTRHSTTETLTTGKKTFATAPVIPKAERIELATKEGLDINHPKYPAYEKAQENITKEQVNTINLFAEGVNLNKLSVEEKQLQVDLLDSAQQITDENQRIDLLSQAEILGQSSAKHESLSKEKFAASQKKTAEVKSYTSEMEAIKAEIKIDPSKASTSQLAEAVVDQNKDQDQTTGANSKSLNEKIGAGAKPDSKKGSIVSASIVSENDNAVKENKTVSVAETIASEEVESFSINTFSKRGGPVYSELNPIPLNPGLPEGLVFKIQIGAFRKPIPDQTFKNLQPVSAETTRPGWLRYCVGMFKTFEPANLVKKELRSTGYKDAFVVAYYNGKRISLQEANALLNQQENQTAYAGEMQKEIAILQQLNVIPTASMNTAKDNDEQQFYGNASKPLSTIEQAIGPLEYSVQVGVYRTANPPVLLNSLEPIYTEALSRGLYRFTSGRYAERSLAETAKENAVSVGVSDAFVVAVRGTKNVSMPAAERRVTAPSKEIVSAKPAQSNIKEPAVGVEAKPSTAEAGLHFKVQLGAFKQNVPFETVEAFLKISDKGIVRITDERGLNIFYAGDFSDFESARLLKEEIVAKGVTDAFVVVLSDGKKIPLSSVLPRE